MGVSTYFTFSIHTHKFSSKLDKKPDNKGPGYYKTDVSTLKKTGITMSVRGLGPILHNDSEKTPGPGQYNPVKISMGKSRSCSFYKEPQKFKHDSTIGPGTYDIMQETGSKMGFM